MANNNSQLIQDDQPSDNFDHITYVPLDELSKPFDGARLMLDRYFVVHPNKGALFYKVYTPQCNVNPSLPERLIANLYPGCHVEFVPFAYVRDDPYVEY